MFLGVKWRFLDNQPLQFQLGGYPELLMPTGDRARDLGEGWQRTILDAVSAS